MICKIKYAMKSAPSPNLNPVIYNYFIHWVQFWWVWDKLGWSEASFTGQLLKCTKLTVILLTASYVSYRIFSMRRRLGCGWFKKIVNKTQFHNNPILLNKTRYSFPRYPRSCMDIRLLCRAITHLLVKVNSTNPWFNSIKAFLA